MAVLVEDVVAVVAGDGAVVPRLADEVRPVHQIVVARSLDRLNALHPPLLVWLRQIFGQLLQVVARHQAYLALGISSLVPGKNRCL